MLEYHPQRDYPTLDFPIAKNIHMMINLYFPNCKEVLDIGMGNGKLVDILNSSGKNAYGIDLRNLEQNNLVIADARQLPFKDDSFDLVIDSYTTCDMMELQKLPNSETNKAVHEAIRVLKPYGGLICNPTGYFYREHLKERVYCDQSLGIFKK